MTGRSFYDDLLVLINTYASSTVADAVTPIEGKVYLQNGDTPDIRKISVTAEDIDVHYTYDKIAEAISVLPPSETRGLSEIWDGVKKKVSEGFQIFKGNPVTKTVMDWTKTALNTLGHIVTFKKLIRGTTLGYDKWNGESGMKTFISVHNPPDSTALILLAQKYTF